MRDVFGSDVDNRVSVRNVYGGARGASVGTRASAATPYVAGAFNTEVGPSNMGGGNGAAMASVSSGKPLIWWGVLLLFLVGLMLLGRKVGTQGGGEFANIKVTAWNTLLVTLMAIIGINAAKAGTAYVNVPGLTPLIHAT